MRNFMKYTSSLAIIMASGMALPQVAVAQDDTSFNDNEIIVTARKREETVLEIPVTVTAFSQEALDERGVIDAAALSTYTPGFTFENEGTGTNSGRSSPQVRFRGIGQQASSPVSRAAAFFWDGAFIADGAGIVPLVDLERAEVIKGPQTAFFGRNTFSGAVNLIPATPKDEFSGRIVGQYTETGEDEGYDFTGTLNVPINSRVRTRVTFNETRDPGDFLFSDGEVLGRFNSTSIQGAVHADVSDNFTLKYSGLFVNADDTNVQFHVPGTVNGADCDLSFTANIRSLETGEFIRTTTTALNTGGGSQCGVIPDFDGSVPAPLPSVTPNFANASIQTLPPEIGGLGISAPDGFGNTYEHWRNHLSADYEFDSGHSLTGLISVGENETYSAVDQFLGLASGLPFLFDNGFLVSGFASQTQDVSIEARITSPQDKRLRYTLGGTVFDQETVQVNFGQNAVLVQEGGNLGIFGSIDFDVTDTLTFSAEGRFAEDDQEIIFQGPPGQSANPGPNDVVNETQSFTRFMPRAILSYQPTSDLNIYGSYSKSFLPGVPTGADLFQASELANFGRTTSISRDTVGFFTDIQELDAFELGIKHQLTDNFRYSAALYHMDWSNQIFFQLNESFTSVFLPGDSEYTGLEFEAYFDATDWLTLSGAFNYVDAEFTDFGAAGSLTERLSPGIASGAEQIDVTGNRPRYIPQTEGTFSVDVDLSSLTGIDAFVRADAIHTGSFFSDNLEFNRVSAYTRFNARVGFQVNDTVGFEVFGNNITDDRSANPSIGTTGNFAGGRSVFGGPTEGREYGVKATLDF